MRPVVHTRRLDEGADPVGAFGALLDALGGLAAHAGPGDTVLIKPNFVAPFELATTDRSLIVRVAEAVRAAGATPVVGETSGYEFDTEMALKILGVRTFLDEHGIPYVNYEQAGYRRVDLGAGLPAMDIAEAALDAKLIVNLPVLKGHSITRVTGAVKNLFGVLGHDSRRRAHCGPLHGVIARLPHVLPPTLHLVDARWLLTRAVFGEVQPLGYLLAGHDPFALDHFGARLLGIDPDTVAYLSEAPRDYAIEGPAPEAFPAPKPDTLRNRVHRGLYAAFYWTDMVKARTVGGNSIIPWLHWYLGVHPVISPGVSDADLDTLVDLCPVGAIDRETRGVVRDRCVRVRCLKCLREGPAGTVRLGGLNPPKRPR